MELDNVFILYCPTTNNRADPPLPPQQISNPNAPRQTRHSTNVSSSWNNQFVIASQRTTSGELSGIEAGIYMQIHGKVRIKVRIIGTFGFHRGIEDESVQDEPVDESTEPSAERGVCK
ncbi:hypothetical protein OPQ81_000700 [Rhizoctonia solani]|nr:hypothetical protein OPQ81_000700 [Rhizoctonia solani]